MWRETADKQSGVALHKPEGGGGGTHSSGHQSEDVAFGLATRECECEAVTDDCSG